jgi:hypothetical protein
MSLALGLPPASDSASASAPVFCFALTAAAEPGTLPRVFEPFAKRGLVPTRVHAARCGASDDALSVDLQIEGIDADLAALIAAGLRQVVGVTTVLTAEKRCVAVG